MRRGQIGPFLLLSGSRVTEPFKFRVTQLAPVPANPSPIQREVTEVPHHSPPSLVATGAGKSYFVINQQEK